MPTNLVLIVTILIFTFPLPALAACHIQTDSDYLYLHTNIEHKALLTFYYDSLCKPGEVELSHIELPPNASVSEQALYYFGLKNLRKYEGLRTPKIPELLKLGENSQIEWISAEAMLNKAIHLIESDLLLEGEFLLHEVIPIARDIGYKRLLGRTYRWLGNVKAQRSNLKSSLNYYKTAYEVMTEIGDDFQTSMTLNNIATVYMQSGEWKRANTYLTRALALYQTQGYNNSLFEAIMYSNVSAIDFAMGRKERSEQYMLMALKEAENTGSDKIKFSTLSNMSQRYSDVGNSQQALTLAKQCIEESQALDPQSNLTLATCYEAYSEASFVAQDYQNSIDYAKRVLDALHTSESSEVVWEIQTLNTLVKAYEAQGNYQQALAYMKLLSQVRQNFYRQTYDAEILSEKNALERQLNKSEIQLLEAQNELQQTNLRSQRTREILFIIFFFALAYLVSRRLWKMKRITKELKNQNTTDSLTGLANRRYIEYWLSQPDRVKKSDYYALSVIDIDHFKQFNDTHGHDVGDTVLKATAKQLKKNTRGHDIVARWGGEEFVLIIPIDSAHGVEETLERVRKSVEDHSVNVGEENLAVTISIGTQLCHYQDIQADWDGMFRSADKALYQAKLSGRNRCITFDCQH
ncbi:tetratricopeptide repeat-containing diguanylate cyclase [Vibrio neptunius]|uniref:tetratricopeptide repeat-containing diguanylate cyclase n=1 Tax=Vibrio neptunius TaxID=170651 RepID=UPI001C5C9CFB|nr:tetratricopeptide repeat-containing diguanylate cyclase [Vibrio neptunius]QXX06038.1 GGDEF domain-containing protein [Vibrio neptunius]